MSKGGEFCYNFFVMEQQAAVLSELQKEFQAHQQSGALTTFQPSPKLSQAFGKLVRTLESRRQLGELTTQEESWLAAVDQLLGRIGTYNLGRRTSSSAKTPALEKRGTLVYDFQSKQLAEEPEEAPPNLSVPKISSSEAERIISLLDQQFEEKVMKKIRERHPLENAALPEQLEFGPPEQASAAGQSLDEYLTKVRADRPNLPFLDEDSYKDLSKLAPSR